MIWLTWRQFRPQAITTAGALIVLAILLAVTGPGIGSAYTTAGLATCHIDCAAVASSFLNGLSRLDLALYFGSVALLYLAPALMGLFWGAPLIAREFEAGTHRIAWNQSVTRTRWTFIKLGLIGVAGMATAGLLSLMVSWWASPIDQTASLAGGSVQVVSGGGTTWFVLARLEPVIFAARGVAPLGYAAFAFALGVTAGVLIRRTLPAMAVTLLAFVVIQVVMPNVVRPHLLPPDHYVAPLNQQNTNVNLSLNAGNGRNQTQVTGKFTQPGAWVLSDTIITPSGARFESLPQSCTFAPGVLPNNKAGLKDCRNALAALHLRESVTYQPASRFWPLQWSETGVYLVLAGGLAWVCVQQVRRRRTP